MARQLTVDQALKVTAGLLLGLLAWQGREMCARVTRLEVNQTRMMVTLGIPPIAGDTLKIQGKRPVAAACERIKEIKPPLDP
jgi:hypothetical protein